MKRSGLDRKAGAQLMRIRHRVRRARPASELRARRRPARRRGRRRRDGVARRRMADAGASSARSRGRPSSASAWRRTPSSACRRAGRRRPWWRRSACFMAACCSASGPPSRPGARRGASSSAARSNLTMWSRWPPGCGWPRGRPSAPAPGWGGAAAWCAGAPRGRRRADRRRPGRGRLAVDAHLAALARRASPLAARPSAASSSASRWRRSGSLARPRPAGEGEGGSGQEPGQGLRHRSCLPLRFPSGQAGLQDGAEKRRCGLSFLHVRRAPGWRHTADASRTEMRA